MRRAGSTCCWTAFSRAASAVQGVAASARYFEAVVAHRPGRLPRAREAARRNARRVSGTFDLDDTNGRRASPSPWTRSKTTSASSSSAGWIAPRRGRCGALAFGVPAATPSTVGVDGGNGSSRETGTAYRSAAARDKLPARSFRFLHNGFVPRGPAVARAPRRRGRQRRSEEAAAFDDLPACVRPAERRAHRGRFGGMWPRQARRCERTLKALLVTPVSGA